MPAYNDQEWPDPLPSSYPPSPALQVLLPLLIILSTLLFLLLLFLISIILLRRRRGIVLRDADGPLDIGREDLIEHDGGFETMESVWLDSVSEESQREYRRAKEWQAQYPPNSQPTDITLSQFLSIQEKGVSAWSFEPDYETLTALLVHSRTEITFLPDPPFASSCVQSNLPLPKLNEVYYWEVKMFDLPQSTNIAVGLATKPYPTFRLPGLNRFSVAYHSNGEKCYNYPFNASSFGASVKEGDVIGVGFRPRHGTVFFTRNGRKTDDAFTGLTRWNLFPTIGADGPCSLHVNLGQSGFVFIEANVKKWGLAPMVGTLAPPPAYGSERGSILLAAGGQSPSDRASAQASSSPARRASRRARRPVPTTSASAPSRPSPLRELESSPIDRRDNRVSESESEQRNEGEPYRSPSDAASYRPNPPSLPPSPPPALSSSSSSSISSRAPTPRPSDLRVRASPPSPDSPSSSHMNPPTPHYADIHLEALLPHNSPSDAGNAFQVTTPGGTVRQPPDYSPLDPYQYSDGVHLDLPADLIQAAIEGSSTAVVSSNGRGRHGNRHR